MSNHQWEWGLTELNKATVVRAIGYDQVSRDFASAMFQVPDRLALTHAPAGFLEIDFGQRRSCLAAKARQESSEEKS